MKEYNKKHLIIQLLVIIALAFCMASFSIITDNKSFSVQASELDKTEQLAQKTTSDDINYTVEQIINELFGDISIEDCEYLYNLDNSADYIYVEFKKEGYAVFLKDTMELLEYSMQGKINYPATSKVLKYYGGPRFYMYKENDKYIDVLSEEYLYINEESAKTYASEIRQTLLSNYMERDNLGTVKYDYSISEKDLSKEKQIYIDEKSIGESPKLDEDNLIRLTKGLYIPNYRYFLLDPYHGYNSTTTCGAVATQLLLSYHNYYSDRRIIADKYLYGDSDFTAASPNLCNDPLDMDSFTLGTRGYYEDGSDEVDSYFKYVIDNVPGGATTSQLKNGLKKILTNRNNELGGNIDYTINSKTGGWFFGSLKVDSSGIVSELDSGRPVILLMQESLGGLNHYVVAYGYNSYTYPDSTDKYLGYITHFGWGSDYLNIWVNSAWCYSYVSLKINHTHAYRTVGAIPGTNRTEYKCKTCGHRTDAGINMLAGDRYVECVASIPQNGYRYKDFYMTFETAGNKLFQTFGSMDVVMLLYDAENKLLKKDDNSGYEENAMFNYTVEANKPYILRVRFYNDYRTGEVKVGITPASVVYSNYEDINTSNAYNVVFSFTTSLNTTCILTYTPPKSGVYEFKTGYYGDTLIDTCLYVIDPYVTSKCYYNDDGAGDLQAKLSIDLIEGRTYFIVVSTYDIVSTKGNLGLSIFSS